MVAAFPLAKIAFLFVKQVSKPLANAVKTRAKKSPFFRNYICMPPAQFYHRCEVRVKMWSMNLGKPVNIPKLNEAQAIDFGAELIGEFVIFGIATLVLMAEYVRSSRKESAKEEGLKQEIIQIQEDLKNLYVRNGSLETQVRELIRIHRVAVPNSTFSVTGHDENDIPIHLRERKDDDDKGMFSTMYSMIWDAVELVLPSSENSTPHVAPSSVPPDDKKQNNNKNVITSPSASSQGSSPNNDKANVAVKGSNQPQPGNNDSGSNNR